MRGMPKKNSSFRIEHAVKERAAAVLAEHGMTLTDGVTAYLLETAYRGEPAIAASAEALAFGETIAVEEYLRTRYGHARASEDCGQEELGSEREEHRDDQAR